jgi:pimeloyl-ACP methyl ester carboxylesterase
MRIFQGMVGLSHGAMRRFRQNTERQLNFRWEDFEVPAIADRVQTPPVLVIHDKGDRETAWQDGADIAAKWPAATLQTTNGLGHNRILRDPAVVESAVRFLAGQTGRG